MTGHHQIRARARRSWLGLVRLLEEKDGRRGAPIRETIQDCQNVRGKNVVQLGIHGFMNSSKCKAWTEQQGMTVFSARTIRKRGIDAVLKEALEIASDGTDTIYVTVDIDVLKHAYVPAASGTATPDGMEVSDLLECMFAFGQNPMFGMMDLVEMDQIIDFRDYTSRTCSGIILTFLGGLLLRLHGEGGYRGY